jgi:hypothetical protein
MLTTKVANAPDGFENRTFECPKCHHTETRLSADPLKGGAAGWLAGELGRQKWDLGMAEYRAYVMEDGHIRSSRAFVCDDDADAIVWANQLVDGHDIELWSGERFVTRLNRKQE